MSYVPRLKTKYHEEVAPQLMEKFGYKSPMQIPRLLKISVNQGVGAATQDKKLVDVAVEEMSRITGQRAVPDRYSSISQDLLHPDHVSFALKVCCFDHGQFFLERGCGSGMSPMPALEYLTHGIP